MHPRSVLFLVAVAILGAVTTSGAADHRIDMSGSAFVPNTIQIVTGDSVAWFNEDGVDHTVTSGVSCSPDGLFDSGTLHAGENFGWRFTQIGTFPYFCTIHCQSGMTGEIVVIQDTSTAMKTWGKIRSLYR